MWVYRRNQTFSKYAKIVFFACGLSLSLSNADEEKQTSTKTENKKIDFNRDVRPILSQHCFLCHGPDAHDRKGKLRLDTFEGARKGGKSKFPAITSGKLDDSEMWLRIISDDPDEVMPPKKFHKDLSEKQKTILKKWIEQGAEYKGHWAFMPIKKAALPTSKFTNPIDKFIDNELKKKNLNLSKKAAPNVLLRRLSFDLTGLPPNITSPDSINHNDIPKAIDRFLKSPHYGERMAQPWLDAARYADTNGFSIDGGRHMWIWRDWVIKAFNKNKPYNDFLIEQLAGDLLPGSTEEQKVATGFQRNNTNTHEGGTIPKENLVNYVADRVKTFGEATMGLTTSCAQCHDHKYDPLSQEEYFQFFAFFNTVSDRGLDGNNGVNSHPFIKASSPLSTKSEIETLKEAILSAKTKLDTTSEKQLRQWISDIIADESTRGKNFKIIDVKHLTANIPNGNPNSLQIDKQGQALAIKSGLRTAINICCEIPSNIESVDGVRITFYPEKDGKLGHSRNGDFILNTISPCFSFFPAKNIDHNSLIPPVRITSSTEKAGFEAHYTADSRILNGWTPSVLTSAQHITHSFPSPISTKNKKYVTTELVFNGGNKRTPSKLKIQLFTGKDTDSSYPNELLEIVSIPNDKRTAEQKSELTKYFILLSPHKKRDRVSLENLKDRLTVLTKKHSTMVMDTAKKPRKTLFLDRGSYASPKHEVHPGTPAFLPPLKPASKVANRLDLARWLTRKDHPLTARVAVNNIWAIFFGQGLVRSRGDFGSQGSYPSHPELLDWLAKNFQDSGWDVKALVKLIVSSETYQQQSRPTPSLLELDPTNQLLARGPRFRLSAEHIRDQALAHSGLLVPRIGGPSVKSYHPGDLWRQVSHYGSTPATAQTYHRDDGEKLYRRSLYTYWKRTLPPPEMAVFDAPSREVCAIGRGSTNTPLQAFILLNSPQFIEASRVFATNLLQEEHADDTARIKAAFTKVTSRAPSAEEIDIILKELKKEYAHYNKDEAAAKKLIAIGDMPPAKLAADKLAAWTNICQLLLNLSETVTRY